MLEQISVYQLNEWMVFEREYGPIDDEWRDEMTAQIHQLIQKNNLLTGMAYTSKRHKKNPAGKKILPVPRPNEMYAGSEDDPDDDDDDEG